MNRTDSSFDADSHRGSNGDLSHSTSRKGRRDNRRGSYKPSTIEFVLPGSLGPEVCPIVD